MRISTQMMYDQNMRGVANAQSSWLASGEQLASGNRVNRPSDDPIAASQAVVLSQSQVQNSQYQLARTFANQKVTLEENVLSQVITDVISAQGKVVNANNASLSDRTGRLWQPIWKVRVTRSLTLLTAPMVMDVISLQSIKPRHLLLSKKSTG